MTGILWGGLCRPFSLPALPTCAVRRAGQTVIRRGEHIASGGAVACDGVQRPGNRIGHNPFGRGKILLEMGR